MAGNIISAMLAKAAFRIRNQALGLDSATTLKITRCVIRLSAEPQRHMLEDGSTYIDTRIIKPIRIHVDAIAPDVDSLIQINAVANDRKSLFQISSRGLVIPDMMIDAELMNQNGENISSTVMKLSFKQIIIEKGSQIFLAHSADASLLERGQTLMSDTADTVSGLYDKASSAIDKVIQ